MHTTNDEKPWRRDDIPVEVIFRDRRETFSNLAEAQTKYPMLNLHEWCGGFSRALPGRDPGTGATIARFETLEVFNLLSTD